MVDKQKTLADRWSIDSEDIFKEEKKVINKAKDKENGDSNKKRKD